jgi:hypothetical protein
VMSLIDWETGCIVQTILSDPLMAVAVDLVTDEDAVRLRDAVEYGHMIYCVNLSAQSICEEGVELVMLSCCGLN